MKNRSSVFLIATIVIESLAEIEETDSDGSGLAQMRQRRLLSITLELRFANLLYRYPDVHMTLLSCHLPLSLSLSLPFAGSQ